MVAPLEDMHEVKYEQSSRSMTCPDVWVILAQSYRSKHSEMQTGAR